MMALVLTLGLLLLVYGLCKWLKLIYYGHKLPPVCPGGLPIVGHTLLAISWRNDLLGFIKILNEFSAKSGGVICGYFLGNIYYGITDFEDAMTVTNALSYKHPYYRFAEAWLGKGLLTASGPIYHYHRKLLNPAFSLSVTYGYLDVFNDESRRLTDIFDSFVGQGPVDCSAAFKNIALRTFCRKHAAFHFTFRLHLYYVTIFGVHDQKDNDFINKYMLAIGTILELIRERILTPPFYNDFIYGISNLRKKLDTHIKFIDDIILEILETKREDMKKVANVGKFESDTFKAFFETVLELADEGALSDKEIIDELNTTATASYETTSQQLVFIAVLLGSYPDEQDKIYKEVMEVVGDRDINKHDIPKLVYTEAFIKECIRMKPVLNVLPRYIDRDVKLKNYTLRAGNIALTFVDGLNREPGWGPNVDEFRPERWLTQAKPLDNLQFAFGYGQRLCPGRRYAMVSMKVTVAHIARLFRLKADFKQIKYKFDVVIRPTSGHEITFERRN